MSNSIRNLLPPPSFAAHHPTRMKKRTVNSKLYFFLLLLLSANALRAQKNETGFPYRLGNANGMATIDQPILSLGVFSGSFSQVLGTPSAPQRAAITGSGLTGPVTLSVTSGVQLALDATATTWSSTLTLHPVNGILHTHVYARLNASSAGASTHTFTLASAGTYPDMLKVAGNTTISGNVTTRRVDVAAKAETRVVAFPLSFSAAPNPVDAGVSQISVSHPQFADEAILSVYHPGGLRLATYKVAPGTTSTRIAVQGLPAGTYTLELRHGKIRGTVAILKF
ncbi:hypothetical protein V9K67_20475 [Paraflavisolibacter sp. H34]|uniref:hypothetical protein n=1 Tax=Huijunlia imazamoxiresistens TaxID=3127457 RepID=UPI0030176C9A